MCRGRIKGYCLPNGVGNIPWLCYFLAILLNMFYGQTAPTINTYYGMRSRRISMGIHGAFWVFGGIVAIVLMYDVQIVGNQNISEGWG